MLSGDASRNLIRLALEEDIGTGDLTVLAVPPEVRACARLIAKENCVVSGLELAGLVLEVFGADATAQCVGGVSDGQYIEAGVSLMAFEGRARDLLTCERTILNFLQRLCGIATQARAYRNILADCPVKVLDTRKTTPGLRDWEKKAVRDGGLANHRLRLDEAVLIKENHIRASGSIRLALANLHGKVPQEKLIEVEVTNWEEADESLQCGVRRLLLDNFSPSDLKALVQQIRKAEPSVYLEASGGVNRENLLAFAATGVDALSVGALTHSVPAVDLSFLFEFS